MLATLILAAVIGQTSQPEAKWYPMSSQPGWEGYGVPDGGLLVPVKWRQIGKPEVEWTLETKKVQKIEEVQEWKQTTVKAEKAPAVPELPTGRTAHTTARRAGGLWRSVRFHRVAERHAGLIRFVCRRLRSEPVKLGGDE